MNTLSQHPEVSVTLSRALLETAASLGVHNPETMLQAVGISTETLNKPENRIPFEKQQALWLLVVERCNTPSFGLHFARHCQPASFGLLGYIAMNCMTMKECLDMVVKYQFLAGQGGEFTIQRIAPTTVLTYTPISVNHPATPHRVTAILAAIVSFGRWLVGHHFVPTQMDFAFDCPGEPEDFDEFFRCKVNFSSDKNAITLDKKVESHAIPNASEELLLLLQERADRFNRSLQGRGGLSAKISSLLASQLSGDVPDKAKIALQLGMSERTMQRRLKQENTSYQDVLEHTRHQLALELLKNTQLSVSEIAEHLGFTEPSAFYRAFKKRQDQTPGQYREQHSPL